VVRKLHSEVENYVTDVANVSSRDAFSNPQTSVNLAFDTRCSLINTSCHVTAWGIVISARLPSCWWE